MRFFKLVLWCAVVVGVIGNASFLVRAIIDGIRDQRKRKRLIATEKKRQQEQEYKQALEDNAWIEDLMQEPITDPHRRPVDDEWLDWTWDEDE